MIIGTIFTLAGIYSIASFVYERNEWKREKEFKEANNKKWDKYFEQGGKW